METERVTRIDSRSMAAILLDVDGVFHVSGRPIEGVGDAVRRLREDGHRIRFVTNNTTSSRADLAEDLRAVGVELDDEELETTPRAAARVLAGKRVLALTMTAIRSEL
jgi:ribonucleotide monophosphatase NagD (HAD superfamily)